MACHLSHSAIARPTRTPYPLLQSPQTTQYLTPKLIITTQTRIKVFISSRIRASSNAGDGNGDGESYLGMWKRAVDREKREDEFRKIADNSAHATIDGSEPYSEEESSDALQRKTSEFRDILEVPREERDRIQRMQVIDRAAAAIAAARSLLKENPPSRPSRRSPVEEEATSLQTPAGGRGNNGVSQDQSQDGGKASGSFYSRKSRTSATGPPGPDFWSWTPPPEDNANQSNIIDLQKAPKTSTNQNPSDNVMEKEKSRDFLIMPSDSVMEKEKSRDFLIMPFETKLSESLPPFQSFMELHEVEATNISVPKEEIGVQFSVHAAEAANALHSVEENPSQGINPDGSRWWKETGIETRPDGVVCRWTSSRGVTADGVVEWEDKYWEAADGFDYKELGSEKSGRDATGNVWHEYWKEAMWQERGLLHMEKTADKWGKNGKGDEWQEKWWEHYDASGKADKWAHKWCSIDPNTQIEAGHAHIWHERWGEKYDGLGGSIKYTDKWAERCEGDAWVKWGDKWDENFNLNSEGVKQGETWWEGKHGERWNRTWGEQHNGSGWVHKYGESSSGEHWDTHMQEDTWYERYPHFGFMHCFQNSVQLREAQKPPESL